jgi:hypothetical protein
MFATYVAGKTTTKNTLGKPQALAHTRRVIARRAIVRQCGLQESQGFEELASAGFVSVATTLVAKATQIWTFKTASDQL